MGENVYFFLLYLFYGLAFYTMGVAVVSVKTRASRLKIAPFLWMFALFAFLHAGNEWLEMFLRLEGDEFSRNTLVFLVGFRLALKVSSYLSLMAFGLCLIAALRPALRPVPRFVPLLLLLGLALSLWTRDVESLRVFFRFAEMHGRYLLGFPGATSAGLAFLLFARSSDVVGTGAAWGFRGAGIGLCVYAVLTGLIPSGTVLPLVPVPIEALRGLSVIFILGFFMVALRIFNLEQLRVVEERLARLAQAEKLQAIGKLAAGIVHEINNPLTNVTLNVEMLKNEVLKEPASPKVLKRFEFIERNVERASHIARELLSFSREKEDLFESLDLNELIESALALAGPRREKYRFRIEKGRLAPVRGIPWKVEEVLLNLMDNAMDASPDDGLIVISSRMEGNEVVIEMVDEGSGIAPEHLRRVAEPFFTTKEVGKGTGLGLSICYSIMELHGGRMELANTGVGTRATLYFPSLSGDRHGTHSGD
ncbi:sensor histidine kinase [Geoalkalibacter sp.]|uniref:sensor histidine kinase n=1 Tax=Geoalkalibacter sp. TaxID=3041440 RepID=UPI00272E9049|nr:ATP-binding protein [Geoalkalibacter sp.]